MAIELDELNKLEREIISYKDYFSKMEISDKEKEERTKLAEQLEILFLFFLLSYARGEGIDYESMICEKYITIANEFLDTGKPSAYISDHARKLAHDVVRTTKQHDGEVFYMSRERAMLISANEANVIGNYSQYAQAVKSGKRYKTWITERDSRVRQTHMEVDGVTIGIFEPFEVGGSLMMWPKDMSLGAGYGLTSNCRCVTSYS